MSVFAFVCYFSLRCRPSRYFCYSFSIRSFASLFHSSEGKGRLRSSYVTCTSHKGGLLPQAVSSLPTKSSLARQSYRFLSANGDVSNEGALNEYVKVLLAAEEDPILTGETCSIIIEKFCKTINVMDVANLLKVLHDKQIYLNPRAYTILLMGAAEANDFALSSLILKDLFLTTKFEEPIVYIHFAKAFQKASNLDALLGLIREIFQLTSPKNASVINRIINSFAKSGQTEKALMIFEEMETLKCKPNIVTFNTVLHILGKAGQLDKMLSVYAFMKVSGCEADVITLYALINNSRKMGRLDLLLVFIGEMVKRGVPPDLRTYTALVDGFGRSGNVEDALKLFDEMRRRQISPSLYIYRALIANLKKCGRCDLAHCLSEEMNTNAFKLVGCRNLGWKNH